MHVSPELLIVVGVQLVGMGALWGDLRAKVNSLGDAMTEEKKKREQLQAEVQSIQIRLGPESMPLSAAKKVGG